MTMLKASKPIPGNKNIIMESIIPFLGGQGYLGKVHVVLQYIVFCPSLSSEFPFLLIKILMVPICSLKSKDHHKRYFMVVLGVIHGP